MNRAGLGRGLASLLPEAGQPTTPVREIPVEALRPNPFQPRQLFDEAALAELADSLRQHGLMQPLLVRPAPDGEGYQLVAGERRWRAARLAGLATVPAVVRTCTERELLEMALVENLQREDINPLEAAEAYRRCLDEFQVTQEELARRVGRSRTAVANTLRLLKLEPAVRQLIAAGRLSEGHGRALLGVADGAQQTRLAERIERQGLSVREAEELVRSGRTVKPRAPRPPAPADPDLDAFAERLQRALGTKVELHPAATGGTVLIRYYDLEDLERLLELLER